MAVWGARGSYPSNRPDQDCYGGATCCVELRLDDRIVVIDAGTGIMPLGQDLLRRGVRAVDLVIGHAHLDHVMGLPFFAPFFQPDCTVTLWFAGVDGAADAGALLERVVSPPLTPFSRDTFSCTLHLRQLPVRGEVGLDGGTRLVTAPLNHPGRATGFRFEHAGRTFAYCSDFEPDGGEGDAALGTLISDAELAFLDCSYTPEEAAHRVGFGHSDWRTSAKLGRLAGLGTLGIFHHDPMRSDAAIDSMQAAASAVLPSRAMRQGEVIDLVDPRLWAGDEIVSARRFGGV